MENETSSIIYIYISIVVEDRFWERFVEWSSHMYPWKIHQKCYHI